MCIICWWLGWRSCMQRSDCPRSRLPENCLYAHTAFVICFFPTFNNFWNLFWASLLHSIEFILLTSLFYLFISLNFLNLFPFISLSLFIYLYRWHIHLASNDEYYLHFMFGALMTKLWHYLNCTVFYKGLVVSLLFVTVVQQLIQSSRCRLQSGRRSNLNNRQSMLSTSGKAVLEKPTKNFQLLTTS